MTPENQAHFEGWAKVEIMGHQSHGAPMSCPGKSPIRADGEAKTPPSPKQQKKIFVEHGGRTYGPYSSREEALQHGFHLPEES